MSADAQYPPCLECRGRAFERRDGRLVCLECQLVVENEIEVEIDFGFNSIGSQTLGSSITRIQKPGNDTTLSVDGIADDNDWCLYDGFNFILLAQVDALIRCGAPKEIKTSVFNLWAAYLSHLKVAFCSTAPAASPPPSLSQLDETNQETDNEMDTIIPEWMSQVSASGIGSELEDAASVTSASGRSSRSDLPFAPPKIVKVKRKKKYKYIKADLTNIPDEELTKRELMKKRRQIRRAHLASWRRELAESVTDADSEPDSSRTGVVDDTASISSRPASRLSYLKDAVEECFPDNVSVRESVYSAKTDDFVGPRSVFLDPEYLTLVKTISFLHAALALNGVQIYDSDLIRWIHEGHIPLYGAYQLLPESLNISPAHKLILGGLRGQPYLKIDTLRFNTARLLLLLGVDRVPKPPVHVLARKIIVDLQLPYELTVLVRKLARIVGAKRSTWKLRHFGQFVDSGATYAGALIMVALKMTLGLDGHTENKISELAATANQLLGLESSSGFSKRATAAGNSSMKTLFVWKEWIRFIEYRRLLLERYHVPTAIRRKKIRQMDPELVLQYARKEGFLRLKMHNYSKPMLSQLKKQRLLTELLEDLSAQHSCSDPSTKRLPSFRPCSLPSHGLAEQLLDFDSNRFGLLRQRFLASSLKFTLKPDELARALKRTVPPVELEVCKGPAYCKTELFKSDFVTSSYHKLPVSEREAVRHSYKTAKLKRIIRPVVTADSMDSPNAQSKLLLFQPCWAYWTRGIRNRVSMNRLDWAVLSRQLPASFRWTLKLVAESLGEQPSKLFIKVCQVETLLLRWSQVVYSADPTRRNSRRVSTRRQPVL